MHNFKDIITRNYLKYTRGKEENIAKFFFYELFKTKQNDNSINNFLKEDFYKDLLKEINTLIRSTVHNYNIDLTYFPDAIIEPTDFKSWQKKRLEDHQFLLDEGGIDYVVKPTNWEETENAKELKEALENGLDLIDPVAIITPSKTVQAEDLVLRKSKLEYLKKEAERARAAKSIVDLDESTASSKISTDNLYSKIEETVKDVFKFTEKKNPDNNKIILSKENYNNLVKWTTLYYVNELDSEKDSKLPLIDSPLKMPNIGVTYIRYAFLELNDELNPKGRRPDSFHMFVASCFTNKVKFTRKLITGTGLPQYYKKLIAPREPYKDQ